jgi:hypothetical protein
MRIAGILSIVVALAPLSCEADALHEQLLELVEAGRRCELVPNNGRLCTFLLKDGLSFTIKDVGGSDTVVGFQHSDIAERFYAVWYFGCIVVVPGVAHPPGYDRTYGAFVSPRTGNVYANREECELAK